MPSSAVSPYALLCASKPKPSTTPSPYDLYSAANTQPPQQHSACNATAYSTSQIKDSFPPDAPIRHSSFPKVQTHYIQDIQRRHNKAAKSIRYV